MNNEYCWMHKHPYGGWDCVACRTEELLEQPVLFRAYLNGLPENSPVGYRRNARVCPIAMWVQLVTMAAFAIEEDIYVCAWGAHEQRTPLWARLFIEIIDSVRTQYEVKRGQALAALDEAERQAAQLLLPQKAESLIRCCQGGCEEVGKVWVTLYAEREETFHLCWNHFTKRFPVQRSTLPARETEPIGV